MPMNMRTGGLASFGGEIRGKVGEDIDPFLDEVADMAESRFNIQLDDRGSRFPMIDEQRPAIDFDDRVQQPIIDDYSRMPRPGGGIGSIFGGGKGRARAYGFNQGGLLGDYDEDMDFSNMSMEEMLEFMKRMKGLSSPMKMRAGGKFVADGRILDAIEFIESGGDPEAINKRTGAAGAYQILDSTALNPGYGVTPISLEDRFDKKKARKFAKEYLEGIAKANPNFTTDDLIQAYHSGPKNVAEGNIGPEGKKYLTKFYGVMNQKPGGLENLLSKTGIISTAEAANEGETKKDDRSFMQKLLDPFGLANPNVPPLPFDRKNLKNYPIDPGLRKFLRSRNVTDENFVDDPVEFDMSLDASDLSLSDLDALQKAGGLPSQAKTIAGAGRVTKKDDEKDKVEKEKEKDKSGEGRLYDKELTGISGDRSDLESDILKLQRQLEKDRDVDKWLSIAKAGLAIADPTKPYLKQQKQV